MGFTKDFMIGAATAAHQVEGNNIHSDYWAQEQMPHTSFTEPSGIACDHYNRYEEDIQMPAQTGFNALLAFRLNGQGLNRKRENLMKRRSNIIAG